MCGILVLNKIFVSSVNKINGRLLEQRGKSFIWRRNNRGLRIGTCNKNLNTDKISKKLDK